MLQRSTRLILVLALVALHAGASFVFADDDDHDGKHKRDHHQQDQMREAVERGDIKPLSDVLLIVQPLLPGEIVGVEAELKGSRWIYEFRVLDRSGRVFEAHVDAATALISKIEEK